MPTEATQNQGLIDQFGRRVDYIRLSITDRCDFRCVYCMSEDMTFLPRNEVLSLEECARLVNIFVGLGVGKVRITGGEPLVRKNALWLFEQIGQLPDLRELVVTTNGSQLESQAHALKNAGVKRINISLDSLDAERFRKITRVGDLNKVLRGIAAAKAAGFDSVKGPSPAISVSTDSPRSSVACTVKVNGLLAWVISGRRMAVSAAGNGHEPDDRRFGTAQVKVMPLGLDLHAMPDRGNDRCIILRVLAQ